MTARGTSRSGVGCAAATRIRCGCECGVPCAPRLPLAGHAGIGRWRRALLALSRRRRALAASDGCGCVMGREQAESRRARSRRRSERAPADAPAHDGSLLSTPLRDRACSSLSSHERSAAAESSFAALLRCRCSAHLPLQQRSRRRRGASVRVRSLGRLDAAISCAQLQAATRPVLREACSFFRPPSACLPHLSTLALRPASAPPHPPLVRLAVSVHTHAASVSRLAQPRPYPAHLSAALAPHQPTPSPTPHRPRHDDAARPRAAPAHPAAAPPRPRPLLVALQQQRQRQPRRAPRRHVRQHLCLGARLACALVAQRCVRRCAAAMHATT